MKIVFLIIIFFSTNILAKDLVEIYRLKGLNEVEKILNSQLTNEKYWDEYFKDKDITLGYYETKKYIIFTQKKHKKIFLYQNDSHNFKKLFSNEVITGEFDGDKKVEGDKKTPIGVYDIVQKKENLDQFYGPLALVTSYPNTFDKSKNKNGYGIWIHGMPLNGDREKYTEGCIALDNENLLKLDSYLNHDKTLIITVNENIPKTSKSDLSKIMATIYSWQYAWKVSNFEEYINFYSEDFRKKDQTGFKEFYNYKKRVFNKDETKEIKLFNFDISPYPNEENKIFYRIVMDEIYKSPTVDFKGKKELIVTLENNQVKILLED